MSSLENLQINETFPGLIKTNNEAAVDGTLRTLQDGAGNNLPIQVSTTGVNFTGTVTGIPVGGVQSILEGTNITVDATDPFNPIVSATGGGGGGSPTVDSSVIPPSNNNIYTYYKSNVDALQFATSAWPLSAGQVYFTPIYTIAAGELINEIAIAVRTAVAATTVKLGLYTVANGLNGFYPNNLVLDLGTVDTSTTGKKAITGLSYTVPSSFLSTFYLGFLAQGGAPSLYGPSNSSSPAKYISLDNSTMNRGMSITFGSGLTALPATVTEAQINAATQVTTFGYVGLK